MWRKLLKCRTIFKRFHKVDVKHGDNIFFWFDNWCSLGPLLEVYGDRGIIDISVSRNATLDTVMNNHIRQRDRVANLNSIEDAIEEVRQRRYSIGSDVHLWQSKTRKYVKKFSSKDTWYQIRVEKARVGLYRSIWFKKYYSEIHIYNLVGDSQSPYHWGSYGNLEHGSLFGLCLLRTSNGI